MVMAETIPVTVTVLNTNAVVAGAHGLSGAERGRIGESGQDRGQLATVQGDAPGTFGALTGTPRAEAG